MRKKHSHRPRKTASRIPSADPTLHLKVARAVFRAVHAGTKTMLESFDVGYGPLLRMHAAVAKEVVRPAWPAITEKQLAAISVRLPMVNYLRPRSAAETKVILELLLENMPTKAGERRVTTPKVIRSLL